MIMMMAINLTGQTNSRMVSSKSHIKFFSTTPAEDIEANNYSATSTINIESGNIAFVVPMQGFEFEKALMQKHFNQENFLDTKSFPDARLVGKITNIDKVDFSTDGTYEAVVEGDMTLKGVTKKITEKGSITVKGGKVEAKSTFNITLADYGIEFVKGKPSSNIAKTVEVSLVAEY
ncbi:MAG: YceI family protein [Bacteroidales bacterium]|nr:YceI family protein [Bacteroidales bacterium]